MATNQITKAKALIGALNVGRGSTVTKITKVNGALNHGSVAATSTANATIAVAGAKLGDVVVASPAAALAAGIVFAGARVSAAGTVTVSVGNMTGLAVSQSGSWDVTVISF